jgi:hypothetical protein
VGQAAGECVLFHEFRLYDSWDEIYFLLVSQGKMSSLVVTRAALCPSFSSPNAGRSGM